MPTTKPATEKERNGHAANGASGSLPVQSNAFGFDVCLSTAVANGKPHKSPAVPRGPLSSAMLDKMQRSWRAANYLEGNWKPVNFLNPIEDGATLPILHVNGYKISGPTVQARTSDEDLRALYAGRGYKPYFVEGDDPLVVHQLLASTLNACYADIRSIQQKARKKGFTKQPV